MMSKIQNLNGTHNHSRAFFLQHSVVYDVKDTKFEWNSQQSDRISLNSLIVYDYKDTKIVSNL